MPRRRTRPRCRRRGDAFERDPVTWSYARTPYRAATARGVAGGAVGALPLACSAARRDRERQAGRARSQDLGHAGGAVAAHRGPAQPAGRSSVGECARRHGGAGRVPRRDGLANGPAPPNLAGRARVPPGDGGAPACSSCTSYAAPLPGDRTARRLHAQVAVADVCAARAWHLRARLRVDLPRERGRCPRTRREAEAADAAAGRCGRCPSRDDRGLASARRGGRRAGTRSAFAGRPAPPTTASAASSAPPAATARAPLPASAATARIGRGRR